ncbi:hypothetical protein [Brevundimonas halotolerans]|uniref:Energy-converting hydrogenase Eha subunit A n=1 Tax=Brevundimonas halotolerans TaxID=69670 RepID=A0A7W9A270_9CAUL|nr:hypothetical protein [Brevundimonas halotolerans]MBB5660064.1 energy-converting hydrogenase Eha subunit A [Brevundimonas halotolerans]
MLESHIGPTMPQNRPARQTFSTSLFRSTAVHVALGGLAMGSWAAFANRDHPLPDLLLAALVQGALSALITLIMKRGLEAGFRCLDGLAARLVPPLVSCLTIAGVLFCAHTLAGTPEVWATLAVPWTVSTTYAFVYVASLRRAP